jgi:uncharacterized protein
MVDELVEFCRFARANGLPIGVTGTLHALEAVRQVAASGAEAMRFALRAALCSSKEEWDLFDRLFEARPRPASQPNPPTGGLSLPGVVAAASSAAPQDGDGKATLGASLQERLRKNDFSAVPPVHQQELERMAQRLLRQLSFRLSRRLKIGRRRGPVDLRRTIRRSIGRGGDPLDLRYRNRKLRQARLVLLLDVSGSMNLYSLFLLRFAHALAKHFHHAETFLFSTGLVNVTRMLRSRPLAGALRAIAEIPAGWSGGTRIGASLGDFNRRYGRHSMRRDTIVMVMSDGWDTGDPEMLATELRAIKRRVRKIVWLNPLLGMADYRPVTRGMAAALPYIDVFAAAHSLESLLELERHLCSTNS